MKTSKSTNEASKPTDLSNLLPLIERVKEALCGELAEYGEMLALLEEERDSVATGCVRDVVRSAEALDQQQLVIRSVRHERAMCQSKLAGALGRPADASFNDLIPLLPQPHQLPVTTLVREINDILGRVQNSFRQNHSLLNQSLDKLQSLIQMMQAPQQAV